MSKNLGTSLVLAALAVSCNGNNSPSNTGSGTLTPAQTNVVVQQVLTSVGNASSATSSARNQKFSADIETGNPTPQTFTLSATPINCKLGGSLTISGSITYTITAPGVNPEVMNISNEQITSVFNNCQAQASDGQTYTINSSGFTVTSNGTLTTTQTGTGENLTTSSSMTGNISMSGTVDVTGATNVNCSMNLNGQMKSTFTTTDDAGTFTDTDTGSLSYSGSVCGNSTSGSFNLPNG